MKGYEVNQAIEALLEDWRSTLAEVTDEGPDFTSILVDRAENDEGVLFDRARVRRSKTLWALQYDVAARQPWLVRNLLLSEVEWHEIAPFQGLSEELSLAAFLLALDPPADVFALMWRAKVSNFDTYAGFDSRYLGVGGVAGALDAARSRGDRDAVDHLMSGDHARFDDGEVAQFVADELAAWFPSDPSVEPPYTWFTRARASRRVDLASEVLDDWRSSDSPPDAVTHSRLLADIGRFREAAEVLDRSLDRNNLLEAIRLVGLQRRANQHSEAFRTLRAVQRRCNQLNDPNGYKRRCVVEEGFLIAAAAAGTRVARRAFKLADGLARTPDPPPHVVHPNTAGHEWLPLVVLEQGKRAAEALGDSKAAAAYAKRSATERHRIGQ